jgi:hypothetical protein
MKPAVFEYPEGHPWNKNNGEQRSAGRYLKHYGRRDLWWWMRWVVKHRVGWYRPGEATKQRHFNGREPR